MDGEEPPCDSCPDKQPELFASNALAWEVWSLLHEFDRPLAVGMAVIPLPIPSDKMAGAVERMGGDEEDFRRVCLIERKMFPEVQAQYNSKKD